MPFGVPLRAEFPPHHLAHSTSSRATAVEELERRTQRLKKLENLYHKGQALAWDGKKVLAELVQKHGPIRISEEKKEALASIFTIILWGELGAWEVASYLAEHIRDNTEAKMAATIQTFDEARHYYVMRDYLELLDVELPEPNSFVKSMLAQLLATPSILYKLVGMQLFVEHVAIHLFKAIADVGVEPVLSDLMYYFQRDEARHIGLGKLYLPELLPHISRREAINVRLYQYWLILFMQLSIDYHRKDAEVLGISIRHAMLRALRDQGDMLDEIKKTRGVRGVVVTPKPLRRLNKWLIHNIWPSDDESDRALLGSPWALGARDRVVKMAERAWGKVA
jgi:hypothetical protein